MGTGALTGYIDVAQVSLYVFWLFFFWLIFYIRRSDRREGYPLESDNPRRVGTAEGVLMPKVKEYRLPHGEGVYAAPPAERDDDPIKADRIASFRGAAYKPNGENPMLDRVGPAAYAMRTDSPELTYHGDVLIQPMSKAEGFDVAKGDVDPRGFQMVGVDDVVAGPVVDIWIDVADQEVRYLEVDTGDKKVLAPMPLVTVEGYRKRCKMYAVKGGQFKDCPTTKSPDSITRLEEDVIGAYFAGGRMYADPSREEPLVNAPVYIGGTFR